MTVEWRPRESDSLQCANLALQTVNVEETPGPTPLSEPSDVFPAWTRCKAPHSISPRT